MNEIEDLIRQAEDTKRKWRKPTTDKKLSNRSWQELLDGGVYPKLRIGRL